MPMDGAGTFTPQAPEFPAVSNTLILASDFNAIILDITQALSMAIFRDGQAALTADLSAGGKGIVNLGALSGTTITVNATVILDLTPSAAVALPPNTTGTTHDVAENSTKFATTAFVHSIAMNSALPLQSAATKRKIPRSDGVVAAWDFVFPVFNAGDTYYQYETVVSAVDYLPYQKTSASAVHTTDPSLDDINWRTLSGGVPGYLNQSQGVI